MSDIVRRGEVQMWLGPLRQWRQRQLRLRFAALEWAEGPEEPTQGYAVLDPESFSDLRICNFAGDVSPRRAAECLHGAGGHSFELRSGDRVFRFRCRSETEDQQWVADIEAQLGVVQERVREQKWSFVRLNVYHFGQARGMQVVNFVTEKMLHVGGIFHAGLELYDREFSYGASRPGTEGQGRTGAFVCEPRSCRGMRYHKTVHLGLTRLSKPEAVRLLKSLEGKWLADDYDVTGKNCVSFCRALSDALAPLGPGIPAWVDSLAKSTDRLCTTAQAHDDGPAKQEPRPAPAKVEQAQLPRIWQAVHQGAHLDLGRERMPDIEAMKSNQLPVKRMPNNGNLL